MTLDQVYPFSMTTSGYVDGSVLLSRWLNPSGLALDDSTQILYVTDTGNNAVRQIHLIEDGTDGSVSILADDDENIHRVDRPSQHGYNHLIDRA
jgi:sugar lactone lactonase YvrE